MEIQGEKELVMERTHRGMIEIIVPVAELMKVECWLLSRDM